MKDFIYILIAVFALFHVPAQARGDVIAVIDTGVFAEGANIENYDARDANNIRLVSESERKRWNSLHGTWIASMIRDRNADAKILSYRVEIDCPIPDMCNMRTLNIYRAAQDAIKRGARIILIPSAGAMGAYAEDRFAELAAQGVHFVFPAGNNGKTSHMIRLATLNRDYIHVIGSVGNLGKRSKFSDHDEGKNVFKWVVGEKVAATDPNGRVRHLNGTSYSAAVYAADMLDG